MAEPQFDTLASLIDNLKDVARLQQLAEMLATNQRDMAESLAEYRELYATRWASLTDLSRRLEVIERTGNDLQTKIERRANEALDEVARSASKLLDRVTKIEQGLAQHDQVDDKRHTDFSSAAAEFKTKVDELHKKIADKTNVTTVPPGISSFKYGKASAAIPNYLIVLLLIAMTIWSLTPVGHHIINKYLTDSASKSETKIDTKDKEKGTHP